MKTYFNILLVWMFFWPSSLEAQDVYEQYREDWLFKSNLYMPELSKTVVNPLQVVTIVSDSSAFQQVRAVRHGEPALYYNTSLKKNEEGYVLDFGKHLTGYVSFIIDSDIPAHAPVQIEIKLAEVPSEMAASFDSYKGTLSKAWLQEEIITLYTLPDTISLPNRYAFRYLRFRVLASAEDMDFFIRRVECIAVSSAGDDQMNEMIAEDDVLKAVTDVSLATLAECMQTVFEDGPKRDRRIWVGDLKLQALANYYSFQNNNLVKRGLYLYAATAAENGLVYGTLFEKPVPHPQRHFPIDYCLLYNTVLYDYYEATGDRIVPEDLWLVAKYQVMNVLPHISKEGIFIPSGDWWYFIDWNENLDKQAALHGTVIYSLVKTWELARILNRQDELKELPAIISLMKKAAIEKYFNTEKQLFTSGLAGQISAASQVWMILSGAVSPVEGKILLSRLKNEPDVVNPVSPYLYHYVVEAMITCGLYDEAKELLGDYWGAMVEKGADTFWEVYDPDDDFLSPYGSYMMNSYCHAWSCTPVYFTRKYNDMLFTGSK